ncbi:MAG: peptide chain release factor 1 [Cytophagales bacterium]|nr:peptide chain release factor 1 [Cytophagales bacterium]
MFNKVEEIVERYREIERKISDESVLANPEELSRLHKEYKRYGEIVELFEEHKRIQQELDETKKISLSSSQDEEWKDMVKSELSTLDRQLKDLNGQLKKALIPQNPLDEKQAIVELRAGTGGDEASLFVGDLLRMYQRYIENRKWKFQIIDFTEGPSGGYKEVIMHVLGKRVYGELKYESGVHRVQRVPSTETQGRVHTSAASVVVLPEMDEIDLKLNMNEIRKDTYCSSGPGGQSVNTTYSAIRLTHIPTGIVVTCQDEKSQIKNFDKALKVLRARLYTAEKERQQQELSQQRRDMVKTGDRSDKIRTYNYPQGRITDHRIKHTAYNLNSFMNGEIQDFIERLRLHEQNSKLV